MYLNENEKQQISKEIELLEEKSSSELVAVITKQCSSYKYETIIINFIIVCIASIFIISFTQNDTLRLFEFQLLIFTSIFFIFKKFNTLVFNFLPTSYKYQKASEYANKQFSNLGLQRTKTKQAIMFFVSLDEKYVKIISDIKIKEKIPDSYWQNIVDDFIKDVKNKELSSGYLKAVKSCNDILIQKFPIQKDDTNELTNEVIEIL